jgi:hypothetical protein
MRRQVTISLNVIAAVTLSVVFSTAPAAGQSSAASAAVAKAPVGAANVGKTWKVPRMPDGQPDLQGVWTNATITPLERPAELAGKAFFTAQEAAEYERVWRERNNMDRRDVDRNTDVARAYNDAWWDRGTRVVKTRRTSLIVDPPDGKLPPLTSDAEKSVAARAEMVREKCLRSACAPGNNGQPVPAEGPEDRGLTERCILWPTAGPPMLPSAYNNNYQIFQGPGYVAIFVEMIHDVRLIPLDGRPHLPSNVRPWMGDSRGHWEGETLVVETTNFSKETRFRNTTENMKLTERFTRTGPDTIMYQFTVEDPQTYTRPWTAEVPMMSAEGPLFEYACHEGNYGMEGLLAGARAMEKKAAEAANERSR